MKLLQERLLQATIYTDDLTRCLAKGRGGKTGIQNAHRSDRRCLGWALLAFERQVWVDTMLNNPNGPDLEEYLFTRMNEDV